MITNSSNSSKRSNRSSRARLASGRFLTRLQEKVCGESLRKMIYVGCVAAMLTGCAAAVAPDGRNCIDGESGNRRRNMPLSKNTASFLRGIEKILR